MKPSDLWKLFQVLYLKHIWLFFSYRERKKLIYIYICTFCLFKVGNLVCKMGTHVAGALGRSKVLLTRWGWKGCHHSAGSKIYIFFSFQVINREKSWHHSPSIGINICLFGMLKLARGGHPCIDCPISVDSKTKLQPLERKQALEWPNLFFPHKKSPETATFLYCGKVKGIVPKSRGLRFYYVTCCML